MIPDKVMDLSDDALELDEDALAGIRRPTLIVSAEDSIEACRLVNARLSGALPCSETVPVPGGHLINPAHPAVLEFVDRMAASADRSRRLLTLFAAALRSQRLLGFEAQSTHLVAAVLGDPIRAPRRHPDPIQTPLLHNPVQGVGNLGRDHLGQRTRR